MTDKLADVLGDIMEEFSRQDKLKKSGKFEHTPDEVLTPEAFLMLVEEVGEVARALCDELSLVDLYSELIQVAAVAARMAKRVQEQMQGHMPEQSER